MKKLLLTAAGILSVFALASCSMPFGKPEPTPVPELNPAEFLTVDDIAAFAGYQPVLDGGDIKREENKAAALYRSEPLGYYDTVEISVTQYNAEVPIEDVWNVYANAKASRTSAEEVMELGENAYIAFPSINIYDRGCYIKITAGSGSDDGQRELLMNLARRAIAKFEAVWPAPQLKEE